MIKLISRDLALVKYRKFPLLAYDETLDEDIFYCPDYVSFYWIKLKEENNNVLIEELLKLLNFFNTKDLIFLGQIDKPWVSKPMAKRFSLAIYNKAIRFFKKNGIWKNFNGAVKVEQKDFKEFLTHFFTLTKFEAYFWDHYFSDDGQNFLFCIHYSGEVQVLTLNEQTNNVFLSFVRNTEFIDSFRKDTDRL
ncbi:hypothetical protein [Paenimyroides aestuarii]|uniref:Uncharacterized protein n=1 Tax=Paenimyroides aestuarii TaxID=2968490 RepID=A0ABY5NNZ3_9FLAO|nr:hypothetical protein [Paenimyroides aestuarii]UUV20222.1 hypothetical protein NPX36_07545 [Paenimyroides aestuarii]